MTRRLLPFALLLAAAPAFAQDAPVATVNGEPIPAAEYYHRLQWFRPDPKSAFAGLPVGFQVVRQMISERIILQMAKAKGVAPSAPEIDARLAEIVAENPNLKDQMAASGTTDADLRAQVTNQEAQFKLLTNGITITDQEVEAFYKNNPNDFLVPKQYKLRVVAVNDDAGQKAVDDALKAGKAFAAVAGELSMDPGTKSNGGEYGTVSEATLSDETRAAVANVEAGKTSAWVVAPPTQMPDGTPSTAPRTRVKFLVEAVTPARTLPLDAPLRSRIRRRLMLQKGQPKNPVAKDLEAATQAAKVTIAEPKFQETYAALLANSKKAQG